MSELIVKLQRVTDITEHPNADRLVVAHFGAWTTCVKKGVVAPGDLALFIPPDAVLPKTLHEHLGITQYCGSLPKTSAEAEQGSMRVRAARLRGVRSFGTLMTVKDIADYLCEQAGCMCSYHEVMKLAVEGWDATEVLDITKYEPPEKVCGGDMEPEFALFHKYTKIERFQNFPDVIAEGEEVVITEKIHGTNCRVGGFADPDKGWIWSCGSHKTRRKEFVESGDHSLYWKPLGHHGLKGMIDNMQHDRKAVVVIVFCEIYGPGIQDMHYGGELEFRVFDISINGEYLDWTDVVYTCGIYGVPTVPELYRGPFSAEKLMELTDGKTTVCDEVTTKFKGREGCVVKPVEERKTLDIPTDRVILKSISADYLGRRGATDNA